VQNTGTEKKKDTEEKIIDLTDDDVKVKAPMKDTRIPVIQIKEQSMGLGK
jgi:hypothetical protein